MPLNPVDIAIGYDPAKNPTKFYFRITPLIIPTANANQFILNSYIFLNSFFQFDIKSADIKIKAKSLVFPTM